MSTPSQTTPASASNLNSSQTTPASTSNLNSNSTSTSTLNPDSNITTTTTTWYPCGLLNGHATHPYAIIILNQPMNPNALDAVIDGAAVLVCADAGADRLYRYQKQYQSQNQSQNQNQIRTKVDHDESTKSRAKDQPKDHDHDPDQNQNQNQSSQKHHHSPSHSHRRNRLPDAIIGDLDSLSRVVEEHYRSRGVTVIQDPDQYSTDFTKCLKWIRRWCVEQQQQQQQHQHQHQHQQQHYNDTIMDVVVIGGLGGRVDQGFSQIHHLYMAETDPNLLQGRIYLLSEQSLSFVLANGDNLIHVEPGYFEENVGIIPVLGRSLLTTHGLEWDVEQWPTQFGGQLSTSNHIRSDEIQIAFQGPRPLFTMELDKRFARGE
ncbi:hypothetical protein A1O3_10255 [Capronia epimyces CBS 606.96]|uniref:Thiamin pyrophosphokinase thiamin-binding domain-containing protein n=1 Tax=Capronia epimyces CBS 606.96 TaxID=1182542 RepID=W9X9F0_9EURO|nr:uncharacterized protein A1O3_10255 [Capronia epimyces CBS 606.96]EXJ77097.1 hypothetical protein A1O3_10255 [Capronia epimyces CBS 606.96]